MQATDIFANKDKAIPVHLVSPSELTHFLDSTDTITKNVLTETQFNAEPQKFQLITNAEGRITKLVVGYDDPTLWALAGLPLIVPEGHYHIASASSEFDNIPLELGWALGAYQFTQYKAAKRSPAKLAIRANQDGQLIKNTADSIFHVRDLINTPPEEMNPVALTQHARELAAEYSAKFNVIVGDDLLSQNFPTVHRVGRAATNVDNQPRLIELNWGDPTHKKLTLVGKGVCFDTGGLDLKSASGMLLMKKDMGGAAHCLGLAKLIMAQQLPISLRVILPVVENAIAGNAMRPSDIITTRKGLTVEVGNTDAEGRLILSDALAYACEQDYDLLLDFATLTGAHNIALGPAIPAILTKNQKLRNTIQCISESCNDLVWPLPLYQGYRNYLDSPIADMNNISRMPYAGCITAGLFLSEFVSDTQKWAHFDLMAYNPEALPGRPLGGDAQALRAVFSYLQQEFC